MTRRAIRENPFAGQGNGAVSRLTGSLARVRVRTHSLRARAVAKLPLRVRSVLRSAVVKVNVLRRNRRVDEWGAYRQPLSIPDWSTPLSARPPASRCSTWRAGQKAVQKTRSGSRVTSRWPTMRCDVPSSQRCSTWVESAKSSLFSRRAFAVSASAPRSSIPCPTRRRTSCRRVASASGCSGPASRSSKWTRLPGGRGFRAGHRTSSAITGHRTGRWRTPCPPAFPTSTRCTACTSCSAPTGRPRDGGRAT